MLASASASDPKRPDYFAPNYRPTLVTDETAASRRRGATQSSPRPGRHSSSTARWKAPRRKYTPSTVAWRAETAKGGSESLLQNACNCDCKWWDNAATQSAANVYCLSASRAHKGPAGTICWEEICNKPTRNKYYQSVHRLWVSQSVIVCYK